MVMTYLQKAAVQGSVTAGVSAYQFGTDAQAVISIPQIGISQRVPFYVLTGAMSAGASMAADMVHDIVDPSTDHRKKVRDQGALIIGVISSAIVFTYGMSLVNPAMISEYGMGTSLAVGVGSEIAAGLVLDQLHEMNLIA